MKLKYFLTYLFLFGSVSVIAQAKINHAAPKKAVVFSKQDSLDAIKELLNDLSFLYDPEEATPYSYGSVGVGVGNGYFSSTGNVINNSPMGKTYYSALGNYNHKSGFGVSLRGLMIPEKGTLTLFQTSISPSYDYTGSKTIGYGITYTHYFIKDSLSFQTSPLINEYYGYISYKKSFIRPMLGINYATGVFKEEVAATRNTPAITSTTNASDLTLIGSIQHYFNWKNIVAKKDHFVFSPTLMAVAGTTRYGTNLSIGSLGKASKHYNTNGKGKGKNKDSSTGSGSGTTTEQQIDNTNFKMQGFTLILGANYSLKSVYLQPQVLLDYSIASSFKRFNTLFNATLGVNF